MTHYRASWTEKHDRVSLSSLPLSCPLCRGPKTVYRVVSPHGTDGVSGSAYNVYHIL
jgi:hypothetical protein